MLNNITELNKDQHPCFTKLSGFRLAISKWKRGNIFVARIWNMKTDASTQHNKNRCFGSA